MTIGLMALGAFVYAVIGYRLVPYFTKYAYDWKKHYGLSRGEVRGDGRMRTESVHDGTVYGFLWPVVLPWSRYAIHAGKTGLASDLFDQRMKKLSSKHERTVAENLRLEQELGFDQT